MSGWSLSIVGLLAGDILIMSNEWEGKISRYLTMCIICLPELSRVFSYTLLL